jgi:hypothetical protein
MPIITQADLATNIYPEVIDEITRADATIVANAINTAVQEAKVYLAKYDLDQLFGSKDTEPTVTDAYLSSLVKDLTCWHLLRLSNVSIDYAVFRTAYEDAIAALKSIMAGQAQPQDWPYRDTATADTPPDGNAISWSSNPRRNNFY